MIVKNEAENILRCLESVAPFISAWSITDTGSTDGTQDLIRDFFADMWEIPGELHTAEFRDFSQARNEALDNCRRSPLAHFDWILFIDADLELKPTSSDWINEIDQSRFADFEAFRLPQAASDAIIYPNVRILRRSSKARYKGVTHEYLAVEGKICLLTRAMLRDHESGSNRTSKWERDIRLLEADLKHNPDNERSIYYLAQSYKAAEDYAKAAELYGKRATMGGWPEEVWSAIHNEARCLLMSGHEGDFVRQSLKAFSERPTRAEPLYDLSKFCRERGWYESARLFASKGVLIKPPKEDLLFIEGWVYAAGLYEEYYLSATFSQDPIVRERGREIANKLALCRGIKEETRGVARANLFYFAQPLAALCPSYQSRPIKFAPPDGYNAGSPSIIRHNDGFLLSQRALNYTLTPDGQFPTPNGEPIKTRNFLVRLDAHLNTIWQHEFLPPDDLPVNDKIQGYEDCRLIQWQGEIWANSVVISPEGFCEQVLLRFDPAAKKATDWRVLPSPAGKGKRAEKNWMPINEDADRLRFLYACDPALIIDADGRKTELPTPAIAADSFRGGSQLIPFGGGWLAVIHECSPHFKTGWRFYSHRFVWWDESMTLKRVSPLWFLQAKQVECVHGLAWKDERTLVLSHHVNDQGSCLVTVNADEVSEILQDAND